MNVESWMHWESIGLPLERPDESMAAPYNVANHETRNEAPNFLRNPQDIVDHFLATTPRGMVVYYGRGSGTNNSPGNVEVRRVIMLLLDYYGSRTKSEKGQLIDNLIEALWSRGFQFQKQGDGDQWDVVKKIGELHKKVSACFRSLKKSRTGKERNMVPTINQADDANSPGVSSGVSLSVEEFINFQHYMEQEDSINALEEEITKGYSTEDCAQTAELLDFSSPPISSVAV